MASLILTLTFVGSLHAQMDPSTALLLRSPNAAPPDGADLDPEIYHVRPRAPARPPHVTLKPPVDSPQEPTPPPVTEDVPSAMRTPAAVGVFSDALALRVAGGVMLLDTRSNLGARQYAVNAPSVGLGLDLWLAPSFGLRGEYVSSVGVRADVQRLDLGVAIRRPDFDVALSYRDSAIAFADARPRYLGQDNHGLDLAVAASRDASPDYAHQAEVHVTSLWRTRLTGGVGLRFGGRWDLLSGGRVFWRAEYTWERNAFTGASADKYLTLLHLGAEWGS